MTSLPLSSPLPSPALISLFPHLRKGFFMPPGFGPSVIKLVFSLAGVPSVWRAAWYVLGIRVDNFS